MDTTQLVGIAAGIFTSVSQVPQLIKIIKNKKAEDVALFMPIILLCGLILWIVYGFMKEDIPIIATNIFSSLVNILVLIFRVIYGKNDKS